MRKTRALRVLVAIAATLAVLAVGQMPAAAHGDLVFYGDDMAWVHDSHYYGTACDEERDGHYVYAQWKAGNDIVTEFDGGDVGCDQANFDYPAYEFRICEETKGCSDWEAT